MSDTDKASRLSAAQKRDLIQHMREPLLTFVALLVLLSINAAAGWFHPFPHVWILNLAVLLTMIATVLLFSMEVIQESSLIRFYSVLGFCWVGILFVVTLIDYVTRDVTY